MNHLLSSAAYFPPVKYPEPKQIYVNVTCNGYPMTQTGPNTFSCIFSDIYREAIDIEENM